jgi:LPXTG-site transpeptidase (sortase) family protein
MRLRVQSRSAKGSVRGALQVLQVSLILVGVASLSIFIWLQFERFYFKAQYLNEFDRLAEVVRQTQVSEPSIKPSPLVLPIPLMPQPPDGRVNGTLILANAKQASSGGESAAGVTVRLQATRGNPVSVGGMRVLGRLRISRIGVEVAVLEGVEDRTLRRGAGWIPGTARPGERGNIGIAAHRDTFFRPLREIRMGDRVEVETFDARQVYLVRSVSVVDPEFTAVLQDTDEPTVTLVSCFPFDYLGPAPRRYIVQARADGVALPATSPKVD